MRLSRLHISSKFCHLHRFVGVGSVLMLGGRLNKQLNEDEMKFQDEGGLLLPPTIEQRVSSTGTLTEQC